MIEVIITGGGVIVVSDPDMEIVTGGGMDVVVTEIVSRETKWSVT